MTENKGTKISIQSSAITSPDARSTSAAKSLQDPNFLKHEARELLNHFSHCNMEALIKVIRNALEKLRKSMQNSSTLLYQGMNLSSIDFV